MKIAEIILCSMLVSSTAMAQIGTNPPSPPASANHPRWSINVLGLEGEALGSFTIELLDEDTDTCMSGHWKKARLIQSSFQPLAQSVGDKVYFPTYETDGQKLTIQLNSPRLCDAYVMMDGRFTEREGRGKYFGEGLGGVNPLGTFTAEKQLP